LEAMMSNWPEMAVSALEDNVVTATRALIPMATPTTVINDRAGRPTKDKTAWAIRSVGRKSPSVPNGGGVARCCGHRVVMGDDDDRSPCLPDEILQELHHADGVC
jgi:hypothetical protein